MPSSKPLLALMLIAALALPVAVAPATAFGQSAGDEQYVDPFQGDGGGGGQGNGNSGSGDDGNSGAGDGTDGTDGTVTPPAAGDPAAEGTPPTDAGTAAGGNGTALPQTGLPLIGLVAAGVVLLAGGAALRRSV